MTDNILSVLTIIEEMVQGQFDNGESQFRPGNICFIKQRYLRGFKGSVKFGLRESGAIKNIDLINLWNIE